MDDDSGFHKDNPREPAPPGQSAWESVEREEREEREESLGPSGGRRVPWGIGDAIAVVVIAWIVLIGVAFLFGTKFQFHPIARYAPVIGAVLGYLIFFLVVWSFAILLRGGTWSDLGFNEFAVFPAAVQAVVWWLIVRILTAIYVFTLTRFGVQPSAGQEQRIVRLFGKGFVGLAVAVIVAVIIAPFVEELLFRGFVYPAFRQTTGALWAIFLTGVLFALVHVDVYLFVPLALIGFALAWLREKSNSIGPPIFLHALNNFISIVGLYLVAGGIGR